MTFEFGDVVVVSFPFTDYSATKKRPAVVVSAGGYNDSRPDVILVAITSQVTRALDVGDVVLSDWEQAGLAKPSAVKLVIGTFSKASLRTKLGSFSARDKANLKIAVETMIER